MAIKARLVKAEYDALEESLKSLYVADGDGFVLDTEGDDGLSGLRQKKDDLLTELSKLKQKFDGIDPDAARTAMEELEAARREKMTAEERHAADLEKLQRDFEAARKRSESLFETQAERDLYLALTNAKVRSQYVEDAAIVLKAKHLRAVEDNGKVAWKTPDGKDVDPVQYISGLSDSKADWFESTQQTGGGASGSGNGGQSVAKQWTREQWEQADTAARSEFSKAGGQVT